MLHRIVLHHIILRVPTLPIGTLRVEGGAAPPPKHRSDEANRFGCAPTL